MSLTTPHTLVQGDPGEHPPQDLWISEPKRSTNKTRSRTLCNYTVGETLRIDSNGKVKLAIHNITGEKVAVKVVRRLSAPPTSTSATEIRTLREAALSMHLYHPHICGIQEMVISQNHYYMFLECADSSSMLDYIICHGRLREKVARKFARQIGSALEYCHGNNVVHRNLCLESILVSQSGDIKIIDFGLSNLYDPLGHLSTFCGSTYYAAPELLNAKEYVGPEVDIWNFGAVLYIFVCGRVPFDGPDMSALTDAVKRGLVEYPVWITTACKRLLSRMLVVNPSTRAPLSEVLNHPWMVRSFKSAPEAHLLHREPLRADELDNDVIGHMTVFGFGSETEIREQIVQVLDSDGYQRAVQKYERERVFAGYTLYDQKDSLSESSLTISYSGPSPRRPPKAFKWKKMFSDFTFYWDRIFTSSSGDSLFPCHTSITSDPNKRSGRYWRRLFTLGNRVPSQSHLQSTSQTDPMKGYHPLISMYFLTREKLERGTRRV